MKTSEINELTVKEIEERIDAERAQLTKLRLNHSISPLENPMKLKETRKNIARLLTNKRERELKQNK